MGASFSAATTRWRARNARSSSFDRPPMQPSEPPAWAPPDKVPASEEALAAACQGAPAFALTVGRLGTFGDRRGPRVIWVDVGGEREAMARLPGGGGRRLGGPGVPRGARG